MTSFAGVSAAKRQGIVQVKKSETLRGSIVRESGYFQMGVGLYLNNFNGIAAVEDESDPPFFGKLVRRAFLRNVRTGGHLSLCTSTPTWPLARHL